MTAPADRWIRRTTIGCVGMLALIAGFGSQRGSPPSTTILPRAAVPATALAARRRQRVGDGGLRGSQAAGAGALAAKRNDGPRGDQVIEQQELGERESV